MTTEHRAVLTYYLVPGRIFHSTYDRGGADLVDVVVVVIVVVVGAEEMISVECHNDICGWRRGEGEGR